VLEVGFARASASTSRQGWSGSLGEGYARSLHGIHLGAIRHSRDSHCTRRARSWNYL